MLNITGSYKYKTVNTIYVYVKFWATVQLSWAALRVVTIWAGLYAVGLRPSSSHFNSLPRSLRRARRKHVRYSFVRSSCETQIMLGKVVNVGSLRLTSKDWPVGFIRLLMVRAWTSHGLLLFNSRTRCTVRVTKCSDKLWDILSPPLSTSTRYQPPDTCHIPPENWHRRHPPSDL